MILRENQQNYGNSNSNSLSDQSAACNKVIAQGGSTVVVEAGEGTLVVGPGG